jgi:cytochrome c oxidase subunit 2
MYKATASQWSWKFNYPGSAAESFNELWMQVGKPAGFTLESTDVLHAFFIPNMRVKRDIVPGRFQTLWFTPIEIGDYHLFCAEYCGKDHSRMYAQVHVVSAEEYAKKPWDVWLDSTPEEAAKSGERLYKAVCSSCHTTDGTASVGPSWKGLFVKGADGKATGGQREVFIGTTKQTITVDRDYILESLRKPEAKKAAGFERSNMTAFELPERKIDGLIEFMKTLADK